jgi:hypothetical protein
MSKNDFSFWLSRKKRKISLVTEMVSFRFLNFQVVIVKIFMFFKKLKNKIGHLYKNGNKWKQNKQENKCRILL